MTAERSSIGSTASRNASRLAQRSARRLTSKATATSISFASWANLRVADRAGSLISGMLPKFANDAPERVSDLMSAGARSSSAAGKER